MAKNEKTEDQVVEEQNAAEAAEETKEPRYKDNREAFEVIARRRMSNVLTALNTLNGLTNKTNYDFTPQHWAAMFGAIEKQIAETKARAAGEVTGAVGFSFGEIPETEAAPGDGNVNAQGNDTQSA